MKGLEDLNYCVKNFFPLGHESGVRLSAGYLTELSEICPEMREFRIRCVRFDSWPQFNKPWTSLVTLWLLHVEVEHDDGFASLGAPGVFPNLRNFKMESCRLLLSSRRSRVASELSPSRTPLLMPDLRSCQSLETVILSYVDLKFPGSPQDELPFPLGLKKLVTNRASVSDFTSSDLKVTVENTLDNCDFKMLNEPFVLRAW